MRPILRPGSHVLRRGRDELQVGLSADHAVILPDDDSVRACLKLLACTAPREAHAAAAVLDVLAVLEASGLVLDADVLLPLLPTTAPAGDVQRHQVAALAHAAGSSAAERLDARRRHVVEVISFGEVLTEHLRGRLLTMLGVVELRGEDPGGRPPHPLPAGARRMGVLVGAGEPRRELVDDLVRSGVPHLLLRLSEGHAWLGPFVDPGRTACLRCLDAHHTDVDPPWPLLVEQHAARGGRDRVDGVPEPVDGLLATIALAWAVRDLASFAEGSRPSTWSTSIRLDPHLTAIESRTWLRHPACGCGWQETALPG